MRKLFNERKLFKGGNYMRKYGTLNLRNNRQIDIKKICMIIRYTIAIHVGEHITHLHTSDIVTFETDITDT